MSKRKQTPGADHTQMNGPDDPKQASHAPSETHLENGASDWSDEEKAKRDESQIIFAVASLDANQRQAYKTGYAQQLAIDAEATGPYGQWLLKNHRGVLDAWRGTRDANRALSA